MKRCLLDIYLCLAAAIPTVPLAQPRSPEPRLVEGQPIETRPPEKADDRPSFPGQTRAPYHKSVPIAVTTLTDKLQLPWSLAFLPDGKMLVTEKPGRMRIVDADGTLSRPLSGMPDVHFQGQVGLLDVALDLKFSTNHRLFFTYSDSVSRTNSQIVVARATLDEAAGALHDVQVIFRAKPDVANRGHGANQGGRIASDRDGSLFVTIGDRSSSPPWDVAQKLDNDLGKIVHITPDGKAAADNPFLNKPGALPEIWTYGHRSEEGLAFDSNGQLWETEHGPRGGDELNKIASGQNYGWPVIVHGIDYPGAQIGAGITEKAGMEQPRYYWDPVIAPSGLAFYTGSLFAAWKNSVFVGALRGMMLDRLTLEGDKVVAEEPLLVDQHARIRDVRIGPDGAVYVLTDGGKLLKLTPKEAE
ncbi:MAG TPA: PQQ-dependent sugar dehydrogenase [Gammaproteobacteria bacterium]|nr:PQQ-dependent sugar dehydrogenase [Gammaproteobacteria bacterium]